MIWFSCLDLHASPESDVPFDFISRWFGAWVVPGRVFVYLPVDDQVVITRFTFPGTDRVRVAWLKVLPVDCVGREVLVAFHFDSCIALS